MVDSATQSAATAKMAKTIEERILKRMLIHDNKLTTKKKNSQSVTVSQYLSFQSNLNYEKEKLKKVIEKIIVIFLGYYWTL